MNYKLLYYIVLIGTNVLSKDLSVPIPDKVGDSSSSSERVIKDPLLLIPEVTDNESYLDKMLKDLKSMKNITAKEYGTTHFNQHPSTNLTTFSLTVPPQPDYNLIRYMAHYAGAAYCSPWSLRRWLCSHCVELGTDDKFINIFEDWVTGALGYVAVDHNQQNIILSFRGSSNLRNWIVDFSMHQVPYPAAGSDAMVHSGFDATIRRLRSLFVPLIQPLTKQYPHYKITVVGHSLGGALATLGIIELKLSLGLPWSQLHLFTYGEPRVGNPAFAIWLNLNLISEYRIVNQYDIVPNLPFSWLGYAHHHREIMIQNDHFKSCPVSPLYLEDPACAPDITKLNPIDHITYFGELMGLGC